MTATQPNTAGGHPGNPERQHAQGEGGQRRGRRRGRRGGRRRRFEERGQPGENRGNAAGPETLPQLRHDNGGILAKPASPEERQHFEAQERGTFHEPENPVEHDDRTLPNPYRIPDSVPRHEATESQDNGNKGGGNDAPSGGEPGQS